MGPGERDIAGIYLPRPNVSRRLRAALQGYVKAGGTLYASDWQYHLLAIAFPEFIDATNFATQPAQRVGRWSTRPSAGSSAPRSSSASTSRHGAPPPSWPARSPSSCGARIATRTPRKRTSPLLVQFPFGDGSVIFTSFHNEAQNSDLELNLLRNLVFKIVTARSDTAVKQTLLQGGFTAGQRSLLSASVPSRRSETYDCRGGHELRFVLGFENRGAELRLKVETPDGQVLEKSGTSSFDVAIPQAAAGAWRYTVTAVRLPFGNFPFTLTVAEKQ